MKKSIYALFLFAFLTLLGWRAYPHLLEAGNAVNQGPLFHDVAVGATAKFAVHGATEIHVMSAFILPKDAPPVTSYALEVTLLSAAGKVRKGYLANLAILPSPTPSFLPDGASVAQERLLSLILPAGTAFLQLGCPSGRVLLRANRLVKTRASKEAVLERSGMPATWFGKPELQGLRSHGFIALPVLGNLPTIRLPPMLLMKIEPDAVADSATEHLTLGPHHAMVVNVVGPGTLQIAQVGKGKESFAVEHVGPGSAGHDPTKDRLALVTLPAGPSSVIVHPLGDQTSLVQLEAQKLHTLGRSDDRLEPAARLGSAWRLTEDKALRFPVYGPKASPSPLRLTAHALEMTAPKAMLWRFLDAQGQQLLHGTLQMSDAYDPFTSVIVDENPVDLGLASQTFLVPPAGTRVLEISAASALVAVDTLLEKGAQAEPLPPFDVPIGAKLRWQDAPVQNARWVMLRPLETQSAKRQLYAKLQRTPRIEPIGPLPLGPWQAVTPRGSVRTRPILEVVESLAGDKEPQSLIGTHHTTAIVVAATGKNARRVVVTCEVPGQLGGQLTLRRNGEVVVSAPILTSTVRLSADAPAGISRVRVDGSSGGHCMIAARLFARPLTVQRSVFLIPPGKGLDVVVPTRGSIPVRLHYAIYAAAANAGKEASVGILVDGGSPARRVGSSTTATLSRVNQVLPLTAVSLPSPSLVTGNSLQRVAVSAVQLGDDLAAGHHRVRLRMLSSGHYWARFWIPGRHHRPEAGESFISTDLVAASEVGP